jgi:hypothetical protein
MRSPACLSPVHDCRRAWRCAGSEDVVAALMRGSLCCVAHVSSYTAKMTYQTPITLFLNSPHQRPALSAHAGTGTKQLSG